MCVCSKNVPPSNILLAPPPLTQLLSRLFSPLSPQGWLDCKLRFGREKRERREMGLNLFSPPPLSTYVPSPLTGENLMAERENSFCVFLQSVIPFFAYYNTVRPCFCFLLLRGLASLSLSLSLSLSSSPSPSIIRPSLPSWPQCFPSRREGRGHHAIQYFLPLLFPGV